MSTSQCVLTLRDFCGHVTHQRYITSDTDSVDDAVHLHHYVKDAANASCMAVRDGGDDVDSGNTYYDNLARGVASGMCAQADVDAAVRNTMRVRFEMGLFDPTDEQPLTKLNASDVGAPEAAQPVGIL